MARRAEKPPFPVLLSLTKGERGNLDLRHHEYRDYANLLPDLGALAVLAQVPDAVWGMDSDPRCRGDGVSVASRSWLYGPPL